MAEESYRVFTDGACRGNPGLGGWAFVLKRDGELIERAGFEAETTNNRMELTAAIEGLRATPEGATVTLTSDSQYVLKGMSEWLPGWIRRNWRKSDGKPVLNRDLWQELHAEAQGREVRWEWVEGHTGHPENERCDELANRAIDSRGAPQLD